MHLPSARSAAIAAACLVLSPALVAAQPANAPANELDAFMAKVLERREVNRQTLKEYVLDEVEGFEILGPGRMPLHRTRREFTWYVRDGVHVRSPLKFNGVALSEDERVRYERRWLERERERAEREAKKEREKGSVTVGPDGITVGGTGIPTEPRFVSEAYFMDFKFEPGNYYLAGREQLEGKEVLRIEYYPTGMFGDEKEEGRGTQEGRKEGAENEKKQEEGSGTREGRTGEPKHENEQEKRSEQELERDIERKMNKTALITLWVDPAEHQIVKYTFENVWLDFLPGAWLVRVDDIRASMTMGQPFPNVWLPRGMNIHGSLTLANGSFEAGYSRAFSEYREADVKSRIRVPKMADAAPEARGDYHASVPSSVEADGRTPGPYVDEQPAQETIGEIRVHGNAFLTDDDVVELAGIEIGQPLAPDALDAIKKRLADSGRFETVEIRKRYRSLTSTTDIAIVLVVHERPEIRSTADIDMNPVLRPIRRVKNRLMFLPIITYADGYGFTYGGRVSTVDLLGGGERLSVPLTWGGMRRAALEFERVFQAGPLTRIGSSLAVWSRENPRFDIRDTRVELKARGERVFAFAGNALRAGAEASRSAISFAEADDRLWTFGGDVLLDTRADPAFPGNAVYLGAGWTGLHFRTLPDRIDRYTADARGYLRLVRQLVLAARASYVGANATLPPYERLLLGGSSTLRGVRTGTFDGDRTFVTSAELRAPITSVLSGAKLGLTAFVDSSKIWDAGQSMSEGEWHRGVGAGVFLIASVVRINLDVARGLKDGDTRVHLSSGFTF